MFGRLPSYGFYCRHVNGLRMRNIEVLPAAAETRPAVICDDVKSLDLDGLRCGPVASSQPVVKLIQTKRAFLRGCVAPSGTKTFLSVEGDRTERVALKGKWWQHDHGPLVGK